MRGITQRSFISVAYSPDGKRLATTSGSEVKIWDAQNGQELLTLSGGSYTQRVVFSPNGHWLLSAGDGAVRIWDATPLPEKP